MSRLLIALVAGVMFASASLATAAEPGAAAPAFSLTDQNGKTVALADLKGKIVVLEWANPGCPIWMRHYKARTMLDLAAKYAQKGVVWLAIDSTNATSPEAVKKWATDNALPYPMLSDQSGEVGRAYGAKTTPHMYIVDADGKIAYNGAIDDDPGGKNDPAARVNYVQKALDELLAGKTVSTPQTKAYGCTVKYAR